MSTESDEAVLSHLHSHLHFLIKKIPQLLQDKFVPCTPYSHSIKSTTGQLLSLSGMMWHTITCLVLFLFWSHQTYYTDTGVNLIHTIEVGELDRNRKTHHNGNFL